MEPFAALMGLPDVGSRPMPDKSRRTSAVLELQMSGNGVYQGLRVVHQSL